MNGEITPTAAALAADLPTREDCITAAQNALRDYKATMLRVIERWCKPVKDGGLGLPIEELAASLGKAPKTLKEYRTELYKLGRLEKTETRGRVIGSRVLSGNPHKNSVPTPSEPEPQAPTTEIVSRSSEPVTERVMGGIRELGPGEYTHQDYNMIIQLFEQINDLLHKNEFTDNFSREEWFSLLGSWQSVGNCVRSKCDHIRRLESNRDETITVDCYALSP